MLPEGTEAESSCARRGAASLVACGLCGFAAAVAGATRRQTCLWGWGTCLAWVLLASWARYTGGWGIQRLEGFPTESRQCLTQLSWCDLKSEGAWCGPRHVGTQFTHSDLCGQPPPTKAPGSGCQGRADAPCAPAACRVEKEARGASKGGLEEAQAGSRREAGLWGPVHPTVRPSS